MSPYLNGWLFGLIGREMLKHGGVDGVFVGANNLTDFLAVLEQHEGRHGAHAKLLRHIGHFVHVELVEAHPRVLVRQLHNVGRDHLARAAPGRKTVDEQRCRVLERSIEFRFAARKRVLVRVEDGKGMLAKGPKKRGELYLLMLWTPILKVVG